jgi:hypothetical protein
METVSQLDANVAHWLQDVARNRQELETSLKGCVVLLKAPNCHQYGFGGPIPELKIGVSSLDLKQTNRVVKRSPR